MSGYYANRGGYGRPPGSSGSRGARVPRGSTSAGQTVRHPGNINVQVPYQNMMLRMIMNPGELPTGQEDFFDVSIDRPDRINVDQLEHRDIDHDPSGTFQYQIPNPDFDQTQPESETNQRFLTQSGNLLDSLIGGRVGYTEPLLYEQRDEAAARFKSEMAKRGITGGAALMAAERDVMKPYNDRITANRQQAVDQAIVQFEGAQRDIAIRNRENEINIQKQNQQISLEQEVKNVGFLLQSLISEADINTRTSNQIAIAAIQAATARRGQSLAALGGLQGLETNAQLQGALADQKTGLEVGRLNQQDLTRRYLAELSDSTQRDVANLNAQMETNRLDTEAWLRVLGIDSDMAKAEMSRDLTMFERLLQDENVDADRALQAWESFHTLQLNLLAITGDIGDYDFGHTSTG